LNVAIYGVEEAAIAPVEDLALSAQEFETLCKDGVLKPHARNLLIKPHVRVWGSGKSPASAHVEIEGFLANSVLRLAGYGSGTGEERKLLDAIDASLVQFLRKTFPQCELTVSPPTVLRQA